VKKRVGTPIKALRTAGSAANPSICFAGGIIAANAVCSYVLDVPEDNRRNRLRRGSKLYDSALIAIQQ
jgi:hypothetical protein